MTRDATLSRLLRSREPSVRLKARLGILREDPDARSIRLLRDEVRHAPRTRRLLTRRNRPGRSVLPGVYHKWLGDHWALASLADLGYPRDDRRLRPMMDRSIDFWLRPSYFQEFDADRRSEAHRHPGVPRMQGRYRRCASQQGNALLYATALGLAEEGCDRLAERLLHWEWPDGGWNCDLDPGADTSSFMETLLPMRGLYEYGRLRRKPAAVTAARRASGVFLRRRLFRRVSDGAIIRADFTRLHYPLYYHYDVLGGLKALAAMGLVRDPRCSEALDLLESQELADGGWRTEHRWYDRPGERARRGTDRVLWDGSGTGPNEWVTADALAVLAAAGRFSPDA